MKKKIITMTTLFVITALLIAVMPASAAVGDYQVYTFESCKENDPIDAEIGRAQMRVRVEDIGENQVMFHFTNLGPYASSITAIYFDDGALLGIASINNGPGVSFSQGAAPPDLPGGNQCDPDFEVTAGFLADSDPPVEPNGVQPNEWVEIIFDLQTGLVFDNVIGQLGTGELRIGIHVQGFDGGGSESFINDGPTAVTLSSFSCGTSRQEVAINWSTGTELNNAGFNLYRSETPAAPSVKINPKMLAAVAEAVSGADYSFTDAPGYGTFYYWLEDVELSGRTMLHGPISVTIKAPYRAPMFRPALPGSG
jgi:hypothetical protein